MDFCKWKQRLFARFPKERAVGLAAGLGVCGILLLYLSSFLGDGGAEEKPESAPASVSQEYKEELEEDLGQIVSAITGEESPTVVVTLENSGRSLFASDERYGGQRSGGEESSQERETSHILLEDADGNQSALTVAQTNPEVQGVVVVSRFAGDPAVQEKLLKAVCTALDVSTAKVCVAPQG